MRSNVGQFLQSIMIAKRKRHAGYSNLKVGGKKKDRVAFMKKYHKQPYSFKKKKKKS